MRYTYSLFLLLSIACNNAEMVEKKNVDTIESRSTTDTSKFVYDASTDGSKVFPKGTKVLADTLGVKLYEVTMQPGDSMPLHNHPDHIFYVIQGGKGAVYVNGGERQEGEMMNGEGFVNGPVLDKGVNTGKTTVKFIVADIYRPR